MKKSLIFKLKSRIRRLMMEPETDKEDPGMKETFNIEDMALITGLSTRTIRSYIAGGFLEGDKSSGSWQFTAEQADAFLQNKTVQPTLRSKKNAIVFDFLGASHKDADAMCVVLDLPSDQAVQVSRLFCGFMCEIRAKAELRFASDRIGKTTRLILSGSDSDVMELLARYYRER